MLPDQTPQKPREDTAALTGSPSSPTTSSPTIQQLSSLTFPKKAPLVSEGELKSIDSWQSVKELYRSKGISLSDDASYLELVKRDWREIIFLQINNSHEAPLPETFPRTTVTLNHQPIELFGFWHSVSMHPDVMMLLLKTLAPHPLVLAEQELGMLGTQQFTKAFDIQDFYARGIHQEILYFQGKQIARAWQFIKRKVRSVFKKQNSRTLDLPTPIPATTSEGQQYEQLQESLKVTHPVISSLSRLSLFLPNDWGEKLPANIDLAYKHETRRRYSLSQARSAYMAEFLRHWDIEATLQNSTHSLPPEMVAKVIERKYFVCGQLHVPEVAFFLKHGSREARVIARAKRDAEILNTQGIDGLLKLHRRNQIVFHSCNLLTSVAIGASITLGISALSRLL